MPYNPKILSTALKARAITRAQLSRRLGIGEAQLGAELERAPAPKQGILESIARELSLPTFSFFMKGLPHLDEALPDFRSVSGAPSSYERETIESIQFARAIQRAATKDGEATRDLPTISTDTDEKIDAAALKARKYFLISVSDQISAKSAHAFYGVVRKKIEDKGIFVLHDSFPKEDGSGFCLFHKTHPLIVVNTKQQTSGRRLFTLVHELAHILLRKSGVCDPFTDATDIEKACNRFAGSFLVPREFLSQLLPGSQPNSPSLDDVRSAARRLKISQEATVFRLEQLSIYSDGSHRAWKNQVSNRNPDFKNKGGGKSPPPQEKVKLARYGFRFARAFSHLLDSGQLSEINLYRTTGLKPKYQRPYFSFANALSAEELRNLELDDE